MLALTDALLAYIVIEDKKYLEAVAFSIVPPGTPEHQVVEAAAVYTRDTLKRPVLSDVEQMPTLVRWNYLYNFLRVGPVTILQYGQHHTGPCQSCSRVFKSLLAAHGIHSRAVALHDADLNGIHGVAEVTYADGSKGMVDPQYGIVYKHADGRPASLQDLRDDPELFLENTGKGWLYPLGPDHPESKASYQPSLYDYKHAAYFNFKRFGPMKWFIYDLLKNLFGPDGPLLVPRPTWYMIPTMTILVGLNSLAAFVAVLTFLWSLRKKRIIPTNNRGQGPTNHKEVIPPNTTMARAAVLPPVG